MRFYGNIAGEPNTYSYSIQPDWHATVSDTHNFGPATLLDVRAGFARNGFDRRPRSAGFDPTELGFPAALARTAQQLYFPTFNVGNYSGVGARANDKFFLGADTYSLVPQVTLIRGWHTMRIGGDFRTLRHNTFNASSPVGSYNFSTGFTQGPDPLRSSLTAGDAYASMLTGTTGSATAAVRASISYQTVYSAGYFQDDIKVNSRLTLNLGLRYDYESPRTERFNRLSFFDFDAINPVGRELGLPELRGGLKFVGTDGNPRGWNDPDRNNFGPRFGFAYQPFSKTAIRGGYGLMYLPGGTSNNGYGGGQEGFSVSSTPISSADGGLTPFTLLSKMFAGGLDQPTGSSLGMRTLLGQGVRGDPRWVRVGYMQEWSFNVQRELPGQVQVEAGYVGSRGVKLPATFQLNSLPDRYLSLQRALLDQVPNPFAPVVSAGTLSRPTVTRGQLLRPFPHFTGVTFPQNSAGSSSYHSFQMRLERRFSKGLSLLAAYTNAKLISDTDGLKSGSWIPGEVSVGAQNPNNLRLERSVAPQDVSQRFVMNYIYELPFGRGKPFLSGSRGLVSGLVGGWTVTGITTLQKGRPLDLTAPNNTNSFGGGSRPNNNGQRAFLPSSDRSLNRWFNTAVFSQPEPFTFGNVGRLLPDVREPGITNFDLSVHRRFRIKELASIEFRTELFNAFNTPQFGRPNGGFGNVLFGTINNQANSPREIQFGLKILY
ncbi:MAG: TonB-dependent receptor [Acidobacteria bacterium]|nr:TonB-dependent receptor [Acidobacteriota bacterium]